MASSCLNGQRRFLAPFLPAPLVRRDGERLALGGEVLAGGTAPGIADIYAHPGFLPVTVEVPVRDMFTGQAN